MYQDSSSNIYFTSYGCSKPQSPILLATPHAGRDYPPLILNDLRISAHDLMRLEDRYVDILLRQSVSQNIPTIIARAPRAIIDLNRGEDEIDAEMINGLEWSDVAQPSPKTRGGLGLIPRRLSGAGEIWRGLLPRDELLNRVHKIHKPYHLFMDRVLTKMKQRFGIAILLDIHSMPSLTHGASNGKVPQWVIGDRYGSSVANIYSDIIVNTIKNNGFEVALNHPYSGGYILERHGNPSKQQHAIQIEIDKSLYLCEDHREPNANANIIGVQIKQIVDGLINHISASHRPEAAE